MSCKDIEELLISYSEGILDEPEYTMVQEHLASCASCRKSLAEYEKVKTTLHSLGKVPKLPDIKDSVLKRTTFRKENRRQKQLRPMAIAVPVIAILVIALSLQFTGFSGNASEVIAKAYETTDGLVTFRSEHYEHQKGKTLKESPYILHGLTEYLAPDRFHVTFDIEVIIPGYITGSQEYFTELISIGNTGYVYDKSGTFTPDEEWFRNSIPSKEKTLDMLNLLIDVGSMDDAIIGGELCYHYFGLIDMNKYIEWRRPGWEKSYRKFKENMEALSLDTGDMDTYIENHISNLGTEMTMELWIGKSDYLIRREIVTYRASSVSEVRFFDFNKEIIIEPPVDESGELLEGWSSYDLVPLEIPEQ